MYFILITLTKQLYICVHVSIDKYKKLPIIQFRMAHYIRFPCMCIT